MSQHRGAVSILIIVGILAGFAPPGAHAAPLRQGSATVEPDSVDLSLPPGTGISQQVTVTTADVPVPRLDVLFLFDVTGSMDDVIGAAKASGIEIMQAVRDKVPDTAFGVGSFGDYYGVEGYGDPGDYPWNEDQPITEEMSQAQAAIRSLDAHGGGDGPESYLRALYEASQIEWRVGAKRVIVLFGDAPAHDPEFYSRDYGVDPGPDAIIGTEDDIRLTEIVDALAAAPIVIVPIHSGDNADALKGFEEMASRTGGRVYSIGEAGEAPAAVVEGLGEEVETIGRLTAYLSPDAPPWATIVAGEATDVGGGESVVFGFQLDVPLWAEPDLYEFGLVLDADGAILATVPVRIDVASTTPPLDIAELVTEKRELISFLSAPRAELTILSAKVPVSVWASNYAGAERAVGEFVSGLAERGEAATPAEAASLSRLVAQEDGLKRLWTVNVDSAVVMGRHAANVWAVGLQMVHFLDFLRGLKVLDKASQAFFETCVDKVTMKVIDAITRLIDYLLCCLPNQDDPGIAVLKNELRAIRGAFSVELDKGLALREILAQGIVPFGVAEGASTWYVAQTDENVDQGLAVAEVLSGREMTEAEASSEASGVTSEVDAVVAQAETKSRAVEDQAAGIEKGQDILKTMSSISDILTLASAAGVVSAWVAPITKALGIIMRIVDAAFSVSLIFRGGSLWASLPGTAEQVTSTAFPTAGLWKDDSKPTLMTVSHLSAPRPSTRPAPAYAASLSRQVAQSAGDYQSLLAQIRESAVEGDPDAVMRLAEQLFAADDRLAADIVASLAPAMAVAGEPDLAEDPAWQAAYEAVAMADSHYSLLGAALYMSLAGYASDPESSEMRGSLIEAVDNVAAAAADVSAAVEQVLPMTEGHVRRAVIAVPEIGYPESVAIGDPIEVRVHVENLIPLAADGVSVAFAADEGIELLSEPTVHVGALGPDEASEVIFRLRLTDSMGSGTVATAARNGLGQTRTLLIHARGTDEGSAPGGGASGGGLGIAVVLLIAAVGGIFLYVAQRRRARPAGAAPGARASLRITAGPSAGQQVPISGPDLSIGRGAGCDLAIPDPRVSRRHARIRYAQGRWFLQDQGSTHGTFVNGQPVSAVALNDGDRISVGDSEIEFHAGEEQRA